jgi:pimeloyl-ACP methyl ester carboxylesterase
MIVAKGYFVVRFDNRDIGLSRHYDHLGPPPLIRRILYKFFLGRFSSPATPYTLNDMAADAFGLLDFLKVKAAHVIGASMGGMIAQTMALEEPTRVLSLCSIMSTTNAVNLPEGELKVRLMLLRKPGVSHEDKVKDMTEKLRAIAHPADLGPDLAEYVDTVIKRSWHPVGSARQINAIMAADDRTEALRSLTMPALILHGRGDRLVPLACGEATAAAIGGDARLHVIEGMGHSLPKQFYKEITDQILSNFERSKGATDVGDVEVSVN